MFQIFRYFKKKNIVFIQSFHLFIFPDFQNFKFSSFLYFWIFQTFRFSEYSGFQHFKNWNKQSTIQRFSTPWYGDMIFAFLRRRDTYRTCLLLDKPFWGYCENSWADLFLKLYSEAALKYKETNHTSLVFRPITTGKQPLDRRTIRLAHPNQNP